MEHFISDAVSPALVTASDIYESDLDSNPVSGIRPSLLEERFMHGGIGGIAKELTSPPSEIARA